MLITKKSMVTGNNATKNIDVTQTQLNAWENGALIQDAMPQVSLSDREFIKTGITNDEWNNLFKVGVKPHIERGWAENLTATISRLRKMGHIIAAIKARTPEGETYTRYRLVA